METPQLTGAERLDRVHRSLERGGHLVVPVVLGIGLAKGLPGDSLEEAVHIAAVDEKEGDRLGENGN